MTKCLAPVTTKRPREGGGVLHAVAVDAASDAAKGGVQGLGHPGRKDGGTEGQQSENWGPDGLGSPRGGDSNGG